MVLPLPRPSAVLAAALLLAAPLPILGQGVDHSDHGAMPAADPVIAAWQAINDRMHAGMALDFTGDPDVDFVRGMIAHHQGAVDMARVVLEHGSDPEIRALAEDVIAAQEAEIALMQGWLAARGLN